MHAHVSISISMDDAWVVLLIDHITLHHLGGW